MTPLPHVVPFEYMRPSPLHLEPEVHAAAVTLGGNLPRQGFVLEALHRYTDPLWWVCRWKNPTTGEKRPLPMRRGNEGEPAFVQKRPPMPPHGFPPYCGWNPWSNPALKGWDATDDRPAIVLGTEGEWVADWVACLGFHAFTWANGSSAVDKTDFRSLAGLWVMLWPDNDKAGMEAMSKVRGILEALACVVLTVDAEALGLPPKADAVDWIKRFVTDHGAEELADIPDGRTKAAQAILELPLVEDWKVAA